MAAEKGRAANPPENEANQVPANENKLEEEELEEVSGGVRRAGESPQEYASSSKSGGADNNSGGLGASSVPG